MSAKTANIFGPHYGWSLWKNEDLLADLLDFLCSGSAVQRSLWGKLEKTVPVSEAGKKRRRTKAVNAVTPLSVVDLVLLLKIPRRRYYCARFACEIAHTSARSTRFVGFCARYVLTLRALLFSGTKFPKVPTHLFGPPFYASFAAEWNQLASRQHLEVDVHTDGVTVFSQWPLQHFLDLIFSFGSIVSNLQYPRESQGELWIIVRGDGLPCWGKSF